MSSSIDGIGVDFNNDKKPVQYKKVYQYLNASKGNVVEFSHQLLKNPGWHPDRTPSLQVVMPILLKALKTLPNQTLFNKLSKVMMSAFSKGKMGFLAPDEAMQSLKELASSEDVSYSEKNIANFFGDSFLKDMMDDKNSRFEGNNFEESMTFILNLLKLLDSENLTGQIQQEFAYCKNIMNTQLGILHVISSERKKLRNTLTEKIHNDLARLDEGESILLPTGWSDLAAGHAMLMKIKRSKNNRYEMLVFNTGGGLENHEQIVGGSKTYCNPIMKFQGLTYEELCDRNFFEALLELRTELVGFESGDLYKGILSRFGDKQVNDGQLSEKFITPQRSGTCTARALMNYIKFYTPSVAYQRLHYRMDKKVLEESLGKYKGKLKQYPQVTKLLKMGAERFARRILKLKKGAIHPKTIRNALNRKDSQLPQGQALSNQEIREGLKIVNRVLKETNGAMSLPKRSHDTFQTLPVNSSYPDVSKTLCEAISKWEDKYKMSPNTTFDRKQNKPIKFPLPINFQKSPPKSQREYFQKLVESSEKAIHSGEDDLASIELTQALLDFPIHSIPQDKKLYPLMTRAANALFAASSVSYADRMVAIYRAFAIGMTLAKEIDPTLGSYTISIRPLLLLQANFNSLSYFSDDQNKLDETLQFFESHNKNMKSTTLKLFSFDQWKHKAPTKTDGITLPIPSNSAEHHYLNSIYQDIPAEAWEKVDAEYEKNVKGIVSNGMTKEEFRISMLWLGSDKIPENVLNKVKHFHYLNQLAIMTELMMGKSKRELQEINLPNVRHIDRLSPETFFDVTYKMYTEKKDQTKYLLVKLGQKLDGSNSLKIKPKDKPAISFEPMLTYTKNYAPKWWPGKKRTSVPLPSRAKAHEAIKRETWADMSLVSPYKDVNSSILENKSKLVFHANMKHNLSTHLLKDFLENELEKLQKPENRTWFKLSLFHHQSLSSNLRDEPLLANQLLEAFDQAIKTTQWQLNSLGGGRRKKIIKPGFIDLNPVSDNTQRKRTLDKYLFLLDMKARLFSHIDHLDSQITSGRDNSTSKRRSYSNNNNSSSSSSNSNTSYMNVSSSNTTKQKHDRSHVEKLRKQLRDVIKAEALKGKEEHTKNYLYASMILAISYESYPPKTTEENLELLKGLNLCSYEIRHGGSLIFITDLYLQDIKHLVYKTVSKHNQPIVEFLKKDSNTLTSLLKELYGISLSATTNWKRHHPIYICEDKLHNEYRANIVTGVITCNGITLKSYQLVYNDEMYKQAFGEKPFSNAVVSSNQNPVKYTIEDEKGNKIHIYRSCRKIDGDVCSNSGTSSSSDSDDDENTVTNALSWRQKEQVVRIEKEFDGRLYVFIPQESLPHTNGKEQYCDWWPSFAKHPYHQNYSTWLSIDKKGITNVKIVDTKKNEVAAFISKEGLIDDFSHSKEHVTNKFIDLSKTPMWSSLSHFEQPYYISAKQSISNVRNGNLTVDFTRYRTHNGKMMRFISRDTNTNNSIKTRLHWEQDPQWFISSRQEIVGFPQLKRFLVIENAEGKRKAILPKLTYSHTVSDCSHHKIDCMTIEIDNEGNLLPQTTYEFAYCAYHSLMNKQYEQAMVFLKEAHSLQPYSPEMLRILGWMVVSEDESPDYVPDALAIKLYAAWLGNDNLFRNKPSTVTSFDSKKPEKLYTHYASPEQWQAYWLDQAYWRNKHSERPRFSAKVAHLYERYLSVRKAVSEGLRVDSTTKLKKKRTSLLYVDEELQLIDNLNASSRQLKTRYSQLLETLCQNEIQIQPNASLSDNSPPDSHEIDRQKIAFIKNIDGASKYTSYRSEVEKRINLRTRHGEKLFLEIAPFLYKLALSDSEKDRTFVADILRDCRFEKVTSNQVSLIKTLLQYMLISPEGAKKIDQSEKWGRWSYKKNREFKAILKSIKINAVNEKAPSKATPQNKNTYQHTTQKQSECSSFLPSNSDLSFKIKDDINHHFLDGQDTASVYYKLKTPNNSELTTIPKVELSRKYARKRYEQLSEDYPDTVKKLSSQSVPALICQPDKIVQKVDGLIKQTENQCKKLESKILKIAQKLPPKGTMERVKAKLALRGRKKEQVGLRDCILAFIQKKEHCYLKLNSIFSKSELQHLHSLVGEYLILKTNTNHYKRIRSAQKNPEELAKLLTITRQYQIAQYPELLVFEYFMGYTLRKDQVEDITDFIRKDKQGSYPNIFKQRMMGAGKTEVLGTLLALMKADGHHLSIMVAPRSLFTTNAQDIKRRSNNIFDQKATTINFTRSQEDFTVRYLAYIRRQLMHAIQDRNFVILPPESLQALENRYFEARDQLSKKYAKLEENKSKNSVDDYIKQLEIANLQSEIDQIEQPTQLLKSILLLIKEKGVITFDEVDAVLQVRKELNFPIGTPETLHPQSCDLVKELFIIAATDPEIIKLGLDLRGNKQHRIKKSDYKKIKPLLTMKICEHLVQTDKWKERLDPILKTLSKGESGESSQKIATKLYQFIFEPHDKSIDLQRIHNKKDLETIKAVEMIILLKQQINEWLSLAWKKRSDEHYGLSKLSTGPTFAIPYVANNTPNENAQFADPWEMVNRTLQLYIYKGLRDDQVQDLFNRLKLKAEHEWISMGQPMDVNALPTVKKVLEATGCNIMELSSSDLSKFSRKLNSGDTKALSIVLDYVVDEVLPTYEQFTEQVTNNSHNLSSIGNTLQGYSGTLENIDTLAHERVHVAPDKAAKVKILNTLIKDNNDRVTIIDDKISFASMMNSILYDNDKLSQDAGKFKALIDIGPLFTGISSEKVAKDIAKYFNSTKNTQLKQGVKGVIFWDDKTNDMKFIRRNHPDQVITLPNTDSSTIKSVTGLKKEELFFYYSHSRITGANAKLQEDAIAVVTFDSQTPIRNWLQGVMRMRQIWQDQRIVTVVPKGVVQVIAKKTGQIIKTDRLTIQNLVPFSDDNESMQQEVDILKSVKQKLQNSARQFVMNQMLRGEKQKEKELFDTHRPLFVRTLSKSMYSRFSGKKGEQDKLNFIKFLLNKYFSKILTHNEIQCVFQNSSSSSSSNNAKVQLSPEKRALILQLRAIVNSNIDNLPDKVDTPISSAWGQESLVVNQQQQTTQQEVNQEQQQEQEQDQEVDLELYSIGGKNCEKRTETQWQLKDVSTTNFPILSPAAQKVANTTSPVVWSLNDFLKNSDKFNHYANLFDDSVCVTKNFLNTFKNVSCFLDRYQKALYEVVAIYQPNDRNRPWKIMMVSLEEASQFKEFTKSLNKNKPPYFMVLEPNAEIVKSGNFKLNDELRKSLMEAILPVLVLSGDMRSLSKPKWRPYIDQWAQSKALLKKNFVELNVLQKAGQKKDLYGHSYLQDRLDTYSKGLSPDVELQFQSILGMTEQRNEKQALELLVQFVKTNDLENKEVFSKCIQLLKAYTSNAIKFNLDDKDDRTIDYNTKAGDRMYMVSRNTQSRFNRNMYFEKSKFNFYPIFEQLLDVAIKQGENGKFDYASLLSDYTGPLSNVQFYTKMDRLVNLLIKNKKFEAAKKFIEPNIKLYRSNLYYITSEYYRNCNKPTPENLIPFIKEISKKDHEVIKKHYDRYLDYKSYLRVFKWMIAFLDAGGTDQAQQLKETMIKAHQKFVRASYQVKYLPAFNQAVRTLKSIENKKNPNSTNVKLLKEFQSLKVKFDKKDKKYKEGLSALKEIISLSQNK
jgi:Protein of unknown function (DUF3638)